LCQHDCVRHVHVVRPATCNAQLTCCQLVSATEVHATFLLFVGDCVSALTYKLENLCENPEVENSVKYSGKKFASASQLERHLSDDAVTERHLSDDAVTDSCSKKCPYVCCFCCKRFTSSIALLQHLKRHNYYTLVRRDGLPASKVVSDRHCYDTKYASNKDLEMLSCEFCSRRFRTLARLRSHTRLSHRPCRSKSHVQDIDAAVGDVGQPHQPSHGALQECSGDVTGATSCDRSLCCKECGADSFKTRQSDRSLCCNECGADSFKTWRSLMLHRRTQHGGRLPHTCPRCPSQFLYASDLRKHERRHTDQRPHVCTVCGKGFHHAADLEVHGRIHRGDVPLTCSVCHRWMSSMTSLRAHMRIHRPDAPPNICTVCDKPFSYLSSLRAHMKRQHAAADVASNTSRCWRCVQCLVEFSSQSLLSEHVTSCRSSTSSRLSSHLLFLSSLLLSFVVILLTVPQNVHSPGLAWFLSHRTTFEHCGTGVFYTFILSYFTCLYYILFSFAQCKVASLIPLNFATYCVFRPTL